MLTNQRENSELRAAAATASAQEARVREFRLFSHIIAASFFFRPSLLMTNK